MTTTIKHLLRIAGQITLGGICGLAVAAVAWIGIEDDNAELQRCDKTPLSGYSLPLVEGDWSVRDIVNLIISTPQQ